MCTHVSSLPFESQCVHLRIVMSMTHMSSCLSDTKSSCGSQALILCEPIFEGVMATMDITWRLGVSASAPKSIAKSLASAAVAQTIYSTSSLRARRSFTAGRLVGKGRQFEPVSSNGKPSSQREEQLGARVHIQKWSVLDMELVMPRSRARSGRPRFLRSQAFRCHSLHFRAHGYIHGVDAWPSGWVYKGLVVRRGVPSPAFQPPSQTPPQSTSHAPQKTSAPSGGHHLHYTKLSCGRHSHPLRPPPNAGARGRRRRRLSAAHAVSTILGGRHYSSSLGRPQALLRGVVYISFPLSVVRLLY